MTQEEIDAIPDELVITLRKPVPFDGEMITTLKLREPTGKELKLITKKSGADADYFAIALISGIPQPFVEEMGARDLAVATDYLASFTHSAHPTRADS